MDPDQSIRAEAILRMKKIIDRGNLNFGKILSMLKAIGYTGYISAEINQHPDQDIVIAETINVLRPLL
jgi:sugar phosphate isomerase/epimerase